MKNKALKLYTLLFFLSYNAALLAQPGANDDNSSLETADAPAAPIDNYLWILGLIGILFVFTKFKAIAKEERFFSLESISSKTKHLNWNIKQEINHQIILNFG